jgi:REP element-mobilizing transposase RayT
MGRIKRFQLAGQEVYFYIKTFSAKKQPVIKTKEKKKLLEIIAYYSELYYVKVLDVKILPNALHLIVKNELESNYSEEQILERIRKYFKKDTTFFYKKKFFLQKYRFRLQSMSEFMRSVKQTFSVWYNKTNHRTGFLWGDRFKSVLLDNREGSDSFKDYFKTHPLD